MTLTLGQVVALDKARVDGRADRRMGHTRCHCFRGPEDDPGAHVHHAPALAPFDDLYVLQTGRGPQLGFGISAPASLALRAIPSTSETFVYVAMTRLMLKRLAA